MNRGGFTTLRSELTSMKPNEHQHSSKILPVALSFMIGIGSASAATVMWTGGGGDDNFGTPENWNPSVALDAGNTLTFDGTTRLTPNNNVTLTGADNTIVFAETAGAFNITGNLIRAGGVTNNSSNLQTINLGLRYNGGRTIDTGSAGITLLQQPASTGGGRTITKAGAGILNIQGSGGTNINYQVNAGTLLANTAIPGTVTVGNTAVLGGTGSTGAVTVGSTAFLAPGTSIGTLGAASVSLTGTLNIEYDGATIDLLNVAGIFDIASATVSFSQLGEALTEDSYIFATYGSLTGTEFATVANLPSGYQIDYAFGGNNIALVAAIPEPTVALLGALGAIGLVRRRR